VRQAHTRCRDRSITGAASSEATEARFGRHFAHRESAGRGEHVPVSYACALPPAPDELSRGSTHDYLLALRGRLARTVLRTCPARWEFPFAAGVRNLIARLAQNLSALSSACIATLCSPYTRPVISERLYTGTFAVSRKHLLPLQSRPNGPARLAERGGKGSAVESRTAASG
jgi:hypothetical protein